MIDSAATIPRRRSWSGFTLVEIMVVVLIISVLATISVPALRLIQRRAKTTTIVNDFRVFAAAFDTYAQEMGGYPVDTPAGVFPTGMDDRIDPIAWQRTTPMGGKYNWENNQFDFFGTKHPAAIAINAVAGAPLPLDVTMLYDLEHTIDSPTVLIWNSGNFRLGSGIAPLYIIQP